jgi:hypothetical protein
MALHTYLEGATPFFSSFSLSFLPSLPSFLVLFVLSPSHPSSDTRRVGVDMVMDGKQEESIVKITLRLFSQVLMIKRLNEPKQFPHRKVLASVSLKVRHSTTLSIARIKTQSLLFIQR